MMEALQDRIQDLMKMGGEEFIELVGGRSLRISLSSDWALGSAATEDEETEGEDLKVNCVPTK